MDQLQLDMVIILKENLTEKAVQNLTEKSTEHEPWSLWRGFNSHSFWKSYV